MEGVVDGVGEEEDGGRVDPVGDVREHRRVIALRGGEVGVAGVERRLGDGCGAGMSVTCLSRHGAARSRTRAGGAGGEDDATDERVAVVARGECGGEVTVCLLIGGTPVGRDEAEVGRLEQPARHEVAGLWTEGNEHM